jgi:hypothetical protein
MNGKQHPLCERDYFRRLDLLCASCSGALRGCYITACSEFSFIVSRTADVLRRALADRKYHVEHFSCSLCTRLFGPQDSYYEREEELYCHFHYSTRFATRCDGCTLPILTKYVSIQRDGREQCWHPDCYTIHKVSAACERHQMSKLRGSSGMSPLHPSPPSHRRSRAVKARPNHLTLEKSDVRPRTLSGGSRTGWSSKLIVYGRKLPKATLSHDGAENEGSVLLAYEEGCATCISALVRHVDNDQYFEALKMAERFILHIEVIFAALDDIEHRFVQLNVKGAASTFTVYNVS